MKNEVILIPLERIRVVNPRFRDKKKFAKVLESIRNLGLKKPIQVAPREMAGEEGDFYDLICGQGRMEAFQALGHKEIPAIVMEVSKEDALLMSLVENIARRFASPIELVDEILRLKTCGYSNVAIGKKLDISDGTVGHLLHLKDSGEERLIHEALNGNIPFTIAIEISKFEDLDQQKAFLEAYEKGHLNQASIRTIRRVMLQRTAFGKKLNGAPKVARCTNAAGLVNAFKKESQRQKILIRKSRICEARLMFIVEAFRRLKADEDFLNLLRAEKIDSIPKELLDKIQP